MEAVSRSRTLRYVSEATTTRGVGLHIPVDRFSSVLLVL